MKTLAIKSFGPIEKAEVNFGDLTILVGPQASGKSIFIQLLKLLVDKNHIRKTLEQYNFIWGKDSDKILDLYFGEGMSKIWKSNTEIILDGTSYKKDFLLPTKTGRKGSTTKDAESLFYIPAQRILSVSDGRPKTFMEFDNQTPYVLKHFSETIRILLQNGMSNSESIFPINNRLKETIRRSFDESIFHSGKIIMDERTGQKKLKLSIQDMNLPFMTWSAGQKEFMPLLMGFYWLCPPSKVSTKDDYKFVVIEEPEMGLHPRAIESVLLQIIDLLSREYKVIISTHSPILLEFAWAFNLLKKNKPNADSLYDLFGLKKNAQTKRLLENILSKKTVNTHYFARTGNTVISKDISELDPGNPDKSISDWGGISNFSSRATDVILKNVNNEG